jgi:LruC domain-containing protein
MLTSCRDKPPVVVPDGSSKDLVVPSGFNLGLVRSLPVSIKLPDNISYAGTKRIIEFWYDNIDGKPGRMVKTGSAGHSGIFTGTIRVPVTAKKIFTNCFAGWRSFNLKDNSLVISEGVVAIDYNTGYGTNPPKSKLGAQMTGSDGIMAPAGSFKAGLENMVENGDFSKNEFNRTDTWSDPLEADGIWYATDAASTAGSVISEEGNSFARIRTDQYSDGGFTQLVEALPGQVVTFSGDARGFDSQQTIHLFVIPRDQEGESIEYFSYAIINPGINWTNGTIAATMPGGTVSCQILFFKGSTGIVDFDNAIVRVNDLVSDADKDGVLDWEDNYPENSKQAFDDFYPAKGMPGSYAFENGWPEHDDYDFNDLVLDYEYNRISNSNNQVVEIVIISQLRAIGTTLNNGFGLQLTIPQQMIEGIKSDDETPFDGISLNENGTEKKQSLATFILFEDAYKVLRQNADGSPTINTTMGFHFILPTERKFRIYLKQPVATEDIHPSDYNPFIFKTGERSREIHLKGFPPTDLADVGLFGTGSDESNLSTQVYYQTKNGLPWAINLPVLFEYTVEKTDILKGHLFFGKWITSAGRDYDDWFMDKQGYRKWDHIYRW